MTYFYTSVVQYITATFVNKLINKEAHVLIKICVSLKNTLCWKNFRERVGKREVIGAAKKLKDTVQLTCVQRGTDYELRLLQNMCILCWWPCVKWVTNVTKVGHRYISRYVKFKAFCRSLISWSNHHDLIRATYPEFTLATYSVADVFSG